MTVVVGYVPNQYGDAALDAGIERGPTSRSAARGGQQLQGRRADRQEVRQQGRADQVDTRLAGLDIEHEVRQTVGTDVADEVLAVAGEVDAELVVIGLRHRTPVGKMLMGSVAQRVLLDARCPVLAVKAGDPP